jgi:hypothetical protein
VFLSSAFVIMTSYSLSSPLFGLLYFSPFYIGFRNVLFSLILFIHMIYVLCYLMQYEILLFCRQLINGCFCLQRKSLHAIPMFIMQIIVSALIN